jgi:circadian clock protein KaiC
MRSIGVDLAPFVHSGLLQFHAARPTLFGLEMHLASMHERVEQQDPHLVIVDPMTNLLSIGSHSEVLAMLVRFIDFLKMRKVTAFFTSLTSGGHALEATDVGVSSLMDTWLLVRIIEGNGERNRGLYVLKSRGMAHSNQVREFVLTDRGIELLDVYTGPAGVLTGTARRAQEAKERADAIFQRQEMERRRRDLVRRREVLAAQIASLSAELSGVDDDARLLSREDEVRATEMVREREEMARMRGGNGASLREEPNDQGAS